MEMYDQSTEITSPIDDLASLSDLAGDSTLDYNVAVTHNSNQELDNMEDNVDLHANYTLDDYNGNHNEEPLLQIPSSYISIVF